MGNARHSVRAVIIVQTIGGQRTARPTKLAAFDPEIKP